MLSRLCVLLFAMLASAEALAQTQSVASAQSDTLQAVREGRNATFILLRHMRKAGGTSVKEFLKRAMLHLGGESAVVCHGGNCDAVGDRHARGVGMQLTEMEWGVFPMICLDYEPRTVFVTCLRDPIERHVSEYWYAGLGRHLPSSRARLAEAWSQWLSSPPPPRNRTKLARPDQMLALPDENHALSRGIYWTNYYIRALTGGCKPVSWSTHEILTRPNKDVSKRFMKGKPVPSCHWGGAFAGGCSAVANASTTGRDLELARGVLERFDMLLILEWLSRDDQTAWVRDMLGLPASFRFSQTRTTPVTTHSPPTPRRLTPPDRAQKRTVAFTSDGPEKVHNPPPPPDIRARLERENALDSELCAYLPSPRASPRSWLGYHQARV